MSKTDVSNLFKDVKNYDIDFKNPQDLSGLFIKCERITALPVENDSNIYYKEENVCEHDTPSK